MTSVTKDFWCFLIDLVAPLGWGFGWIKWDKWGCVFCILLIWGRRVIEGASPPYERVHLKPTNATEGGGTQRQACYAHWDFAPLISKVQNTQPQLSQLIHPKPHPNGASNLHPLGWISSQWQGALGWNSSQWLIKAWFGCIHCWGKRFPAKTNRVDCGEERRFTHQ